MTFDNELVQLSPMLVILAWRGMGLEPSVHFMSKARVRETWSSKTRRKFHHDFSGWNWAPYEVKLLQ